MGEDLEKRYPAVQGLDVVLIGEGDHFLEQSGAAEVELLSAVNPEYVVIEEYKYVDMHSRLRRYAEAEDLDTNFKGKPALYSYLREQLASGELKDVDACDDMPASPLEYMIAVSYDNEQRRKLDVIRETNMGEAIVNYVEQSSRPVAAITGADHIGEDSKIRQLLDEAEVSYETVVLERERLLDTSVDSYVTELLEELEAPGLSR